MVARYGDKLGPVAGPALAAATYASLWLKGTSASLRLTCGEGVRPDRPRKVSVTATPPTPMKANAPRVARRLIRKQGTAQACPTGAPAGSAIATAQRYPRALDPARTSVRVGHKTALPCVVPAPETKNRKGPHHGHRLRHPPPLRGG